MSHNRIYRRLFIPYVIVLLLSLGGAWLATTQFFSETLEKRLQLQLIHSTELLANGTFPYTDTLVSKLSRLIRADIALLDNNMQITITTVKANKQQFQQQFHIILKQMNHSNKHLHKFKLAQQHYLLFWKKVTIKRDPRVSYIIAFANLSDIHKSSQRAAKWLALAALSVLIILAWMGHFISRSITLPIRELADMANKIALGNRTARVKIHRNDEIGELAVTLNAMAEKLLHYDNKIAKQSRMAALGQMTARIAHEIRNPLTAIKMQLQLLKETTEKKNQALLSSLLDETRRLELIVLSTLQHKKQAKPVFTQVNINYLIQDLVQLLTPQFEHQGIQFNTSYSASLPEIKVDRDMITQILLNLLLNAKDELSDGGIIRLSTGSSEDNTEIFFIVEDSGSGIAEQDWPTLFSDPANIKPDGFGLGLNLSHELVKLHQGQISISQSSLNGACFTISLPLTGTSK